MPNKIHQTIAVLGITLASCGSALAAQWEVTVTNLTHGNHFTPVLMTAHAHDIHLFKVGEKASEALEYIAECGNTGPMLLTEEVGAADADTKVFDALLAPGESRTETLTVDLEATPAPSHLTVLSMLLPTNDAFLGLQGVHISAEAGTYVYLVNAYDAGTEKNDEVLRTSGDCDIAEDGLMPGAPGGDAGSNGTGVAGADSNDKIHVHRGLLGDSDLNGGPSDVVNTIHRWQNPVAKITVTVTP